LKLIYLLQFFSIISQRNNTKKYEQSILEVPNFMVLEVIWKLPL